MDVNWLKLLMLTEQSRVFQTLVLQIICSRPAGSAVERQIHQGPTSVGQHFPQYFERQFLRRTGLLKRSRPVNFCGLCHFAVQDSEQTA